MAEAERVDTQIIVENVGFLDNCFDFSFQIQSTLEVVKEYVSEEDKKPTHIRDAVSKKANNTVRNSSVILDTSVHNETKISHCSQSQVINKNLRDWGLPLEIAKKYEQKGITEMFEWQVTCLGNAKVLLDCCNLVYSAPTSAGKTLVAEILTIKTVLERQKKVIIILPFVSIVREKMFYLQDILSSSGIRVEGFMGSQSPPGGLQAVHVAICTIEKANSLINRLLDDGNISDLGAVIVDELHLLGDPHRGYILELLLTKIKYVTSKMENVQIQIVGMSATLPNLEVLATWLDAELFVTQFRPIPLDEFCLVNNKYYDKQGKFVATMKECSSIAESDNVLKICLETIKEGCSILIFCMTKNRCENLAQSIASSFFKLGCSGNQIGAVLRQQLKSESIAEVLEQLKNCPVGLDQILKNTISFGVAYHHAGLTFDERDIIEGAFKSGAIRVLVATSTLSSGVNLPARKVIIRTPVFQRQPINILTYKQMIGRAGRMGRDIKGESILVCTENEKKIGFELMMGALDPVESCIESEDKYMRAILEMIASQVACSKAELDLYSQCTLLYTQQKVTPSQNSLLRNTLEELQKFELVRLQSEGEEILYVATPLGKACLSSSMAPNDGLSLFCELQKARQCLVLETDLHLIYLVTPYSVSSQWADIDWLHLLTLWESLTKAMKKVGELVGVQESFIIRCLRGASKSNNIYNKLNIHKRFYTALALQDLVNEVPLSEVATKFQCARGFLQSLQQSAATFAGMVTAFCHQLGWKNMEMLVSQFQDRLHFGIHSELLELMKLPSLNGMRARSLFNAGFETLSSIATAEANVIENALYKALPFQSEKEREGDDSDDTRKRNKMKNIWITGCCGMTTMEAAENLITEARRHLELDIGGEIKWKNMNAKAIDADQNNQSIRGQCTQKERDSKDLTAFEVSNQNIDTYLVKMENKETNEKVDAINNLEIDPVVDTRLFKTSEKVDAINKSEIDSVVDTRLFETNEKSNATNESKRDTLLRTEDDDTDSDFLLDSPASVNFYLSAKSSKSKVTVNKDNLTALNKSKPNDNSSNSILHKLNNESGEYDKNKDKSSLISSPIITDLVNTNIIERDSKDLTSFEVSNQNIDTYLVKMENKETNEKVDAINNLEIDPVVDTRLFKTSEKVDAINKSEIDSVVDTRLFETNEKSNATNESKRDTLLRTEDDDTDSDFLLDSPASVNFYLSAKSSKSKVTVNKDNLTALNKSKPNDNSSNSILHKLNNESGEYDKNKDKSSLISSPIITDLVNTNKITPLTMNQDDIIWDTMNFTDIPIENSTKLRTSEKMFSPDLSFSETEDKSEKLSTQLPSSKTTSNNNSLFSDGENSNLFEESLPLDTIPSKLIENDVVYQTPKLSSQDNISKYNHINTQSMLNACKSTIIEVDDDENIKLIYEEDKPSSDPNDEVIGNTQNIEETCIKTHFISPLKRSADDTDKENGRRRPAKKLKVETQTSKSENISRTEEKQNQSCICLNKFSVQIKNTDLKCAVLKGRDINLNLHVIEKVVDAAMYFDTNDRMLPLTEPIGSNIVRNQAKLTIKHSEALPAEIPLVKSIAICTDEDTCVFIDVNSLNGDFYRLKNKLRKWFLNSELNLKTLCLKGNYKNVKQFFDTDIAASCSDVCLAEWLIDSDEKIPNIVFLMKKYCQIDLTTTSLRIGNRVKKWKNLDSTEELCVKAWCVRKIAASQSVQLLKLYQNIQNIVDIEMQIAIILAGCEYYGVTVDKDLASRLLTDVKSSQDALQKKAYKICGYHFNFNSSKDVAKVLGIYKGRKVSTKKSVLCSHNSPMSSIVIYWRKLNSILTKTLYPLTEKAFIFSEGNRITPSYTMHTCSGRISMHEPNLQSVPRTFSIPLSYLSDEVTHEVVEFNCRNIFRASPGHALVSADYCQLELRILTHYCQDEVLVNILRSDVDVFKAIAASWGGVPEEEVDDDLRQKAKQLCYGIIYGMGNKTLSQTLDVSEMEAAVFMDTFHKTYPAIRGYTQKVIEDCRRNGYIETLTKRRRYLPEINSNVSSKKSAAERQALNTTIQGSAADIAKSAMCAIYSKTSTDPHKPRLILQMHDELIYEVPEHRKEAFMKVLKQVMESSVTLRVPLPVKVKSGHTWGTLEEVKL